MKTSLKKGTIFLTLSSLIFITSGYIINIFLGRYLGPELYGSYGVLISIITVLNILQTSGFTQAASKYIAEDEKKADSIIASTFRIQIVFTSILAILLFLLSDPIAKALNDRSLSLYIKLSVFILPFYSFYSLLVDYYNGMHYFKKQAILNSIYSISKAILVIFFAFIYKLSGIIYALIISPIIAMLFGFYFPHSDVAKFSYKKLILFSIPLVSFALFSTLLQSTDLYFVKAMLLAKDPGYYTASQNISRLLYFATVALSGVLLPSVSRSISQNLTEHLEKTIHTALRIILCIVIPGSLIISATSSDLLQLIYSHVYLNAAPVLSILSVSIGFYTIYFLLCTILNAAGKPIISSALSILGVAMNAVFCLLLIPVFNMSGAAVASMISNFIILCVAGLLVYKKFHTLTSIRSVVRIILASLVIYFLAKLIILPIIFLPLLYLFLLGVYVLLLILMKEITKEDVTLMQSLVPAWVLQKQK